MNDLGPLFAQTAPYQRGSRESRDGAKAIAPSLQTLERRVLDAYTYAGESGMTDEELAAWTRIKRTTAIPRRHSLMERGLVVKLGRRKARSGVRVGVYGLAEYGR